MPVLSGIPALAELPFHTQLMLAVVIGSALLCFAVVALGAIRRCMLPDSPEKTEPLFRCDSFPFVGDQLYTAFFLLVILSGAVSSLLPTMSPPAARSAGMWFFLQGLATLILLYLPMLMRYAMLHRWHAPARPWHHYVTRTFLFWGYIYLSISMLETCGFTSWLVRVTDCPEHQNLVLNFSRGDVMQRLYIIISAVLIAPVAEECCFRGFPYTTLRHWSGRVAATMVSALFFGAIHASLAQLIPLVIFGVIQCVAYEKEGSLWLPIAVHVLFNSTSLIATLLLLP